MGEHLSVDNMNKAIQLVSEEMNISIPEFTVAGVPHGSVLCTSMVRGLAIHAVDPDVLRDKTGRKSERLNDDYAVERKSALKDISVKVLPPEIFIDFMRSAGKEGGQHKFPRVLKGKLLKDWQNFLEQTIVKEQY